jgi:hypothetical protein
LNQSVFEINPGELNDIDSLRAALNQTLNFINTICEQNQQLLKQNQELKDEINRLKQEKGKPNILPNSRHTSDISSQRHTQEKKEWKKESKKDIIKIDNRVSCSVEKDKLPADAIFKGYDKVISQDIIFKRDNTEYTVEIWYSPSQKKTYRLPLPETYTGYFGNNLKAFCITMHYAMDVTRNKLLSLLSSIGIEMSDGSLQNILTENSDEWIREKNDLLKAGMQGPYVQTDSTGARVKGQNHWTHVFVSEFFSVYSTLPGKSRLNILGALQGQPQEGIKLKYNKIAAGFFKHFKVPGEYRIAIEYIFKKKPIISINEFELIKSDYLEELKGKPTFYKWAVESLAFGYYFEQSDYPAPDVLVSDDAKEYELLAKYRMLCWIHDARYYNKLTPFVLSHRLELEKFKQSYWNFYELLKKYKKHPSEMLKSFIEAEFDRTFNPNTSYFNLNKEIKRTLSNKKSLLTVLDYPFVPLHNNASELAARRQVRKRDICLHTMTDLGTKLQDAYMSIIHTCFLLGVDAYGYILNKLNNCSAFYLPDLVIQRIKQRQFY